MKVVGRQYSNEETVRKNDYEQLIDFAMKLLDDLITNQTELINDNKDFREKLNVIEAKFDSLKKENETLQSKVVIAGYSSTTLFMNHKKLKDKITEMERKFEQYLRRDCIEFAGVPNSITNDLLEEHVILIFEKLGVVIEAM